MNVIDALNSRRSVRQFKSDPVSRDTILKIMAAAGRSPSWADTQPWEVFIATGKTLDKIRHEYLALYQEGQNGAPELTRPVDWPGPLKQRMMENMAHRMAAMGIDRNDEKAREANTKRNYDFFGAPAVAYLCLDRSLTAWSIFDMGILAQSIMIAGQEYGVDSIPAVSLVAYPDVIRTELGISGDLMILFGIAMGYIQADDPVNKPRSLRRPVEAFVHLKEN